MPRIYWDSCIAIYRIEQVEPWASRIAQLITAIGDDFVLHVSDLTWMECRVAPLAAARTDLLARYDTFFARPEISWSPMDRRVFAKATELRAAYRLKTPDALHLAAALAGGCDELWTNDHRLDAAAAESLRMVVPT